MLIGIDASRAVTRQRTGTEAYAFFLIQALIPLAVAAGHTLRLYFNQPPPSQLFPRAKEVEHITIPFSRLWTHVRLAYTLHRHPPNIFFTPAHVIPYTYRQPSVATLHDVGYHHFPEAHTRTQLAYLRWSTQHNGRISRRIIADSKATQKDLIRFHQLPPDKIDVIYPGIDPLLAPASTEAITNILKQYHIRPPYLLHLSTLQPRKNLIRLIQAYAVANIPHQLILAGKTGWLAQPILQAIADLPSAISQKIILPGFIPDEHKASLLSGATALLYPSLYEGFGFPALEAQACGTAVLCANTSSLPEIVNHSALQVDPLNTQAITQAIHQLTQKEALRQSLISQGFHNVKRFNWQQTAQQVLTTLEKAVQ